MEPGATGWGSRPEEGALVLGRLRQLCLLQALLPPGGARAQEVGFSIHEDILTPGSDGGGGLCRGGQTWGLACGLFIV